MKNIIQKIVATTNLSIQQAWWLLEFVTNKTKALLQFSHESLTTNQEQQLEEYMQQISVDEKPLAYILGWVPFLDLKIFVTPPTLIPRPETEHWVDELINSIKKSGAQNLTILDLGTGSGCIALSLAQAFPQSKVYALDIALSAIALAQKNAIENDITNITFLQSDLFNNLPQNLQFDLIVSNPPYINPTAQLDASVLNWEDHGALFANDEGMHIINQIACQAKSYLKKNDELDYQLVIEIDACQGNIVKNVVKNYEFTTIEIHKDQFDRDRTTWAK